MKRIGIVLLAAIVAAGCGGAGSPGGDARVGAGTGAPEQASVPGIRADSAAASGIGASAPGETVLAPDAVAGPLHPRAFELVTCWMSDTVQPVVTEVSLDALAGNDDQFLGPVTRDGEWVQAPGAEGEGFLRYRVIGLDPDRTTTVEFQSNAGGTLTTSARIGYRLLERTIQQDGETRILRVLRIVRFD